MKNLKLFITFIALCVAAACGTSGPANTTANNTAVANAASNANAVSNTNTTVSTSPADELADGKSIYEKNCATCHKEDGTGGKTTIEGKTINAENLTEEKFKKADDSKLFKYVHDGIEDEGMPAFKDKLTEAQIREVIRYVRVELQKMPAGEATPAASPAAK